MKLIKILHNMLTFLLFALSATSFGANVNQDEINKKFQTLFLPFELHDIIRSTYEIESIRENPKAFVRIAEAIERICATTDGKRLCDAFQTTSEGRISRIAERFFIVRIGSDVERDSLGFDAFTIRGQSFIFRPMSSMNDLQLTRLITHEMYLLSDLKTIPHLNKLALNYPNGQDRCSLRSTLTDPVIRLSLSTMRALYFEDLIINELFSTAPLYLSKNPLLILKEVFKSIENFPPSFLENVRSWNTFIFDSPDRDLIEQNACRRTQLQTETQHKDYIPRIGSLINITIGPKKGSQSLLIYLINPTLKAESDSLADSKPSRLERSEIELDDMYSGPKPSIGDP